MKDIELHIGYKPTDTKARVLDAIRCAEMGPTEPERHVTFASWHGFSRVLSGKRLDLLRHVRQHAASSVAELAHALGRDYKRVHEDVEILEVASLLDRTAEGAVIPSRVEFDSRPIVSGLEGLPPCSGGSRV